MAGQTAAQKTADDLTIESDGGNLASAFGLGGLLGNVAGSGSAVPVAFANLVASNTARTVRQTPTPCYPY